MTLRANTDSIASGIELQPEVSALRIELERQRKTTRRALVVVVAIAFLVPTVGLALPSRKAFSAGEPIRAQDFNDNFAALWTAVEQLEATVAIIDERQPTFYGSLTYPAADNCDWRSSATSGTGIPADADCAAPIVAGAVTAPATKIPGLVLTGRGSYLILMQGAFWGVNSPPEGGRSSFWLSDGILSSSAAITPAQNGTGYSPLMPSTSWFVVEIADDLSHPFALYVDTDATVYVELANHDTSKENSGLNFQVFRFSP